MSTRVTGGVVGATYHDREIWLARTYFQLRAGYRHDAANLGNLLLAFFKLRGIICQEIMEVASAAKKAVQF